MRFAHKSSPSPEVGPACGWSIPRTIRIFGLPVSLVFFLAAIGAVVTIDAPLARLRLQEVLPESFTASLNRLEAFGHGVGAVLVLIAVWSLDPARRTMLPRLTLVMFFSGTAANFVKLLVARQRPYWWVDLESDWSSQFVGLFPLGRNASIEQSFPSGHTATAVGLALGLAGLYPRGRAFFLTTAALVALQRVVFNSHYLSDVLAAAGIAWLVAGGLFGTNAVARFFDRFESKAESKSVEPRQPERRAA